MLGRGHLVAAVMLLAASAAAQARDPAAAEAMFHDGRKAASAGDHRTACEKFRESQRLDPAAGTLLNIAICEEQLGELASAWQHYTEVAHTLGPDDDRLQMAKDAVKRIEPRVPRLSVRLGPGAPPDTRVSRGGVDLGAASLGVALPANPGRIVVVAVAAGREPKRYEVTLGPGDARELVVEPGAPIATPAAPRPEAAQPAPATREPPVAGRGSAASTAGWILTGFGVVGLGVSGVTGLMVLDRKSTVESQCDEQKTCSPAGIEAGDSGKTLSTVSTVAFAVGAVAGATGVYLILTSGGETHRTTALGARAGPGAAGVSLTHAF